MTGVAITGWGTALPKRAVRNQELATPLGVSADWISQRTGIHSRRIAGAGDTTSMLGATASAEALNRAGVSPRDVDLVILATLTPDHQLPATASLIQTALGCTRAGAYDLHAGCAGFLYALAQAHALILSGAAGSIVVCGAEILSRVTDRGDVGTAVLFGDAAGAVVVQGSERSSETGRFVLHSDGSAPEMLWIPPDEGVVRMQGREVYRRAVEEMSKSLEEVLRRTRLSLNDIDLVVVHQANARIIEAVAERIGCDPAKLVVNIDSVGNTSAASIPLALADAARRRRLQPGARVAVVAFGAGFAWGAGVVQWGVGPGRQRENGSLPALVGTFGHLVDSG